MCQGHGHVNITKHGGVFAGVPETMAPAYIRQWGKRIPKRQEVVEVPCRSLTSLMQDNGLSRAEFLSLDVQGAEEVVLRAVNPSVFKLIMVEMDRSDKKKEQRIDVLLHESGFEQTNASFRVPYSAVYIAKSTWSRHALR